MLVFLNKFTHNSFCIKEIIEIIDITKAAPPLYLQVVIKLSAIRATHWNLDHMSRFVRVNVHTLDAFGGSRRGDHIFGATITFDFLKSQ